jgi:hypothetical protein
VNVQDVSEVSWDGIPGEDPAGREDGHGDLPQVQGHRTGALTEAESVEVLSPGTYTHREFDADLSAVRQAAKARETVIERVRKWDSTNSLDMARRLVRMRTEGEDYWRGPGMKGNDREFYEWVVANVEGIESTGWAKGQLMAGRALVALESQKVPMGTFPIGASQIRDLGSSWYLERPQAIANVWQAAVEETGGQPGKELVAAKARRYKADLQSVEETKPGRQYEDAERRDVSRALRAIRKRLVELHRQDPGYVEAFLRDLSTTIRAESREVT